MLNISKPLIIRGNVLDKESGNMKQETMFEALGVGGDVRTATCACGCGETFSQAKVGRVRIYKNDTHKSRAYRKRAQIAARVGDEMQAFVEWVGAIGDAMAEGATWEIASDSATEFFMAFAGRRGAKMFNGFYDAIALFRGEVEK